MENTNIAIFDSTIKYSETDIFIQPVCDFFGIDYLNQKKMINRSQLLKTSVSKKTSMLLFGDERERIALTKTGFIAWILQLRCQIVHPSLQENLVQYQTYIIEYLYREIKSTEEARTNYSLLKKYERHLKYVQNRVRELKRITDNQTDSLYGIQTQLALIEK